MRKIYLAGGCFWGMERALQILDENIITTVGYANGKVENPSYERVCQGDTDFRETVEAVYDENTVTLEKILQVYFICVDPTAINRQGHDIGTQYQAGVYYCDEESRIICENYFKQEQSKYDEFHVELKPLENFYPGEEYHQDYLIKNPQGYCYISLGQFDEIRKIK